MNTLAHEHGLTAELTARFRSEGGRTQLCERACRAPLKLAKSFPLDGGSRAGIIMMDVSPGMMAGDRYRIDLGLGPGADVYATNQSSTKVHPCGSLPSSQEVALRLGPGSRLDYRPEPVMLYTDGSLRSRTLVTLAPGALLMLSEVLGPGRWLRGEAFRYRLYETELRVLYGESGDYEGAGRSGPGGIRGEGTGSEGGVGRTSGRGGLSGIGGHGGLGGLGGERGHSWLGGERGESGHIGHSGVGALEEIFYSRQRFAPLDSGHWMFAPGHWREWTHMAAFYVFSDRIGLRHKEELQAWAETACGADRGIGISMTYKHGLAMGVMGRSVWELQRVVDGARAVVSAW